MTFLVLMLFQQRMLERVMSVFQSTTRTTTSSSLTV